MIVKAINLTMWDNGFILEQPCKVNTETSQVFDIEHDLETLNTLETLQGEWVIVNGVKFPLVPKDEYNSHDKNTFWYNENT
jgi:hypothetical protein